MREKRTNIEGKATNPIQEWLETNERLSGFLRSLASGLRQEDEDEDEAKEADAAVEEEGGGVAERLLQVSEGLGHDEPAEVGDQVGQGVRPTAGSEIHAFKRQVGIQGNFHLMGNFSPDR